MAEQKNQQTVIIGAGIIGAAIGLELQRRGHSVLLLERDEPGMGASFGNMACIAVTGFMAVSRPSTWKKIPGWMLDPNGPVCLRPTYALKAMPWFLRFMAAGRPAVSQRIDAAMAGMSKRVFEDLPPMLAAAQAEDLLTEEGCLSIYETQEEFDADKEALDLFKTFGFEHEVLSGGAIRDLEPAISAHIPKAVVLPQNRTIRNPFHLVQRLVAAMVQAGGRVEKANAVSLETRGDGGSTIHLSDGRRIETGQVVLAAGVRTRDFASQLGEPLPLETERGYHTQIMAPGVSMSWSLIWPRRAFMITPTAGGIRVGGSVEMAGLDAKPNYRRADVLVGHAKRAVPQLNVAEATQWMGHRPALPDTLPVISPSSTRSNVWYATGHGHLGLTYAATTARVLADMMAGLAPPIDMAPFNIKRYQE
jgi:D-amino-acid dehydrogenase